MEEDVTRKSEGRGDFLLAVISLPGCFDGEADMLEGLLESGLQKLHLRKPRATDGEKAALLERLAPRWASRLVWHGSAERAVDHGIPQVHGSVGIAGRGLAVSTSVHSWAELKALPAGLAYAFISPLFDSISKPGYGANKALLQQPDDVFPCMPVGLGGIGIATLGEMMRAGWMGAAVLGEIWEEPLQALRRYEGLKKIIHGQY